MFLVDARRWIDVRASPVLLELLGLKGSFFGFHRSLVILSNYSNLRRFLTQTWAVKALLSIIDTFQFLYLFRIQANWHNSLKLRAFLSFDCIGNGHLDVGACLICLSCLVLLQLGRFAHSSFSTGQYASLNGLYDIVFLSQRFLYILLLYILLITHGPIYIMDVSIKIDRSLQV